MYDPKGPHTLDDIAKALGRTRHAVYRDLDSYSDLSTKGARTARLWRVMMETPGAANGRLSKLSGISESAIMGTHRPMVTTALEIIRATGKEGVYVDPRDFLLNLRATRQYITDFQRAGRNGDEATKRAVVGNVIAWKRMSSRTGGFHIARRNGEPIARTSHTRRF
jgi:hypothetical protein